MNVKQVVRMNGGLGENSYANNSGLHQRKYMLVAMPIIEEAITQFYSNMALPNMYNTISMADFGCSSGPGALELATQVIKIIDKLSTKLNRDLPEFHIQLNDLPGNDFNTIFQSLIPQFEATLVDEIGKIRLPPCFVTGVPGSYYGRLFPAKSLHFVHSSYSLMWLSKVPEEVEMNKDNISMASTSPASVIKAYYKQFQSDFATFIKCRSEEVAPGGKMVLTIMSRKTDEDPSTKQSSCIWDVIGMALKEMVVEGVVEEEKLHSFNVPEYMPTPGEVKIEVEKEGSFTINHIETSEVKWNDFGSIDYQPPAGSVYANDNSYNATQCIRSVAEPLLAQHFGALVIDDLFAKCKKILSCGGMPKEDQKSFNVTVSMTRMG